MEPSEAAHYQGKTWDLHVSKCYERLVLEGFVKSGETLKHLVWGVDNTDFLTLFDLTLRYGRTVQRPYLLGQRCDGSIGAPVMALYLNFCSRHSLDAQALYERAYPGERKLEPEATTAFARWQGVQIPYTWTAACFRQLLASLTQVNEGTLRSVLADAAEDISFPGGVLERDGYVAFRGTTRCYGPEAHFTWGHVVTPTGERVWQYDPWQSKNGVVPRHYWLSFIAIAACRDKKACLEQRVIGEAERNSRSAANKQFYQNWLKRIGVRE